MSTDNMSNQVLGGDASVAFCHLRGLLHKMQRVLHKLKCVCRQAAAKYVGSLKSGTQSGLVISTVGMSSCGQQNTRGDWAALGGSKDLADIQAHHTICQARVQTQTQS